MSWFALRDRKGRAIVGWPLLFSVDTSIAINRRARCVEPDLVLPKAIYAGTYFPIFGHFLTETTPNLAAVADYARSNPDIPILMHLGPDMSGDGLKAPSLKPWAAWFHEKVGIEFNRLRFITAPMRIRELHVPPSPLRRKHRYLDRATVALDRLFSAPAGSDELIYFSRSRWPKPRLAGEAEIERRLADRGYAIVHPQELTLDEQLSVIRGARSLVGAQGTALHWSLYSTKLQQVVSLGWPSGLQKGICLVRGQSYLELRGRRPKDTGLRVREVSVDRLETYLDQAAVEIFS
ncbi:MAG: glycosyltransferase family 61 protein [Rhodobacteraceae bacterium]|nr:glycosyltransferase family 61 protein [Paracoccaceae bacterium]MBR9821937.1 glycosyltransferase family 61 protein [Paracoccaceae bacterium]